MRRSRFDRWTAAWLLTAATAFAANPDAPMPMFGGHPSRNMVNLVDKSVTTDFEVEGKTNIKWVAKLGSRAYGGPIISGGKVFVGTNNQFPRNERDTLLRKDGKRQPLDKGIL